MTLQAGSETSTGPTSIPPVLRIFFLLSGLLWLGYIASVLYCQHSARYNQVPYNVLTLVPSDDYADMLMFNVRILHYHQPSFFNVSWGPRYLYPAPIAFVYYLLSIWGSSLLPPYEVAFWLVVAGAACWLFFALQRKAFSRLTSFAVTAATVGLSYPLYFVFNRANVEILIWICAAAGVVQILRGRFWLAALLIALAGACKGYPFLFLGLLVSAKKYRQAVVSVGIGLALNLVSFWGITNDFTLGRRGVQQGLERFQNDYVLSFRHFEVGLDHSIWGTIKHIEPALLHYPHITGVLKVYTLLAALVGCLLYVIRVRHLPVINQVIFLTVAAITLPPTSFDYTLLHLYIGWVLLLFFATDVWRSQQGATVPGLLPAFLCFALLLTPQNEVIYMRERLEGILKCATLLGLAFIVYRHPFRSAYDELLPTRA